MRRFVVALGFLVLAAPALAYVITPADAGKHVGQMVTVEGIVSNVHTAPSGITFIDMGGRYPHNAFTAVIFSDYARKFPDVGDLGGRTVDITGAIALHNGKPEIILKSADQLKTR